MRPHPVATPVTVVTVIGTVAICCPSLLGAERWTDTRRIGPLLCHADFSLDEYLPLLQGIAGLQKELDQVLGVGTPQENIHLYLFSKKSTYRHYMARHFPNVPNRKALFIKGRGPGMVFAYLSRDFSVDLRHECTHALLHAALPVVPLWLDEGLAEYFEVSEQQRQRGHPHWNAVRWYVRFRTPVPITDLESIRELKAMGPREYRFSWAWVQFMLHGSPAAREELVQFLKDIRLHTPPGRLSERLQRSVPNAKQRFADHFGGPRRALLR